MKQQVAIGQIRLNDDNPRIIRDDKFLKLVESIKSFPEMLEKRPIIVNAEMVVLGGNMRLRACKEAGLKTVWIDIADGWTEDQQREFTIKDNASFGEWDWDQLGNEWDEYPLEEWGLNIPSIPDLNFDEIESTADRETKKTPIKVRCPECECEFEV